MQKINTHTQFPAEIDMSKYVKQAQNKPELYDLYGVLVHVGGGLHFGHYYCFVKNSNDMWYCMNDSSVSQRSFQDVAKERPYLLFYVKKETITRPKRKSSSDFTNIQIETINQTTIEQNSNLIKENKEINSNEKCKENMKYIDDLFGSKQNNKKEEKQFENHMKKPNSEENNIEHEKKNKNGELQNHSNNQKEQKMESEMNGQSHQEKNGEEDQNNDELYYQLLKDKLNNRYQRQQFQVVRFKRIKKLKYIADNYLREKIRSEMLSSSRVSYQESTESEPRQNGNGQHKSQKSNQINNASQNQEALQNSSQKSESTKVVSNGSTAQSTPVHMNGETKQNQKANDQQNQAEIKQDSNKNNGILLKTLQQKSDEENKNQTNTSKKDSSQTSTPLNMSVFETLTSGSNNNQWSSQSNKKYVDNRASIIESNKKILEYQKKEKDEYDVEYDKGKLKKIKKKKEKQRINFDKLSEQNKKQKSRGGNGYLKQMEQNKRQKNGFKKYNNNNNRNK